MQLNTHYSSLPQMNSESVTRDKTLEKIASAKQLSMEDSSSQTIASMLQSDISSIGQGLSNANDGISMMQIANGTLSTLTDQAQTLNDLSVRYTSPALNEDQKQMLQGQFTRTVESMQQSIDTTSYNGQSLFGNSFTFSLGNSSINASLGDVSPKGLSIDNPSGISNYAKTLENTANDVGSAINGFISTSNSLLANITATSAAKSQISDADMTKMANEFQQSNSKLTAAQIASAHQNSIMRQTVGRLLG
jgi:flagellin